MLNASEPRPNIYATVRWDPYMWATCVRIGVAKYEDRLKSGKIRLPQHESQKQAWANQFNVEMARLYWQFTT